MNIDLENAKNEFLKYVKNYDLKNSKIERKKSHSLRVMEISKNIAKNLELSQEEIGIATLIGLLHDIARFEQYKKYHTYNDLDSIDHGDFGVLILENEIRNYIKTDKYDNIIKAAIKNHNKFRIQNELTDREKIFAQIIRDADKIDIFYEALTEFWICKEKEVEESILSEEILEEFKSFSTIKNRKESECNVEAYKIVKIISFIFDINFKISFQILKKEDYINKILDNYKFKDEYTKNAMEEIKKIANDYIEKHI